MHNPSVEIGIETGREFYEPEEDQAPFDMDFFLMPDVGSTDWACYMLLGGYFSWRNKRLIAIGCL
jgi:hypothetical protein